MLPSKYRLPLRTDLVRVQKNGRLFQGKFFSILVAQGKEKNHSRFGFIISTKVNKKAVKRNRVRRLLTEAIQSLLGRIKPGHDLVFLAKKGVVDQEFNTVKKEAEKLFTQAGLLTS